MNQENFDKLNAKIEELEQDPFTKAAIQYRSSCYASDMIKSAVDPVLPKFFMAQLLGKDEYHKDIAVRMMRDLSQMGIMLNTSEQMIIEKLIPIDKESEMEREIVERTTQRIQQAQNMSDHMFPDTPPNESL